MDDTAVRPCTCGETRHYWRDTATGPVPFCGECHRMLDTNAPAPTPARRIPGTLLAIFIAFDLVVVATIIWVVAR